LIFQYASFNNSRSLHFFLAAWPVVWHMPALTEIFGDDSVLQFGGGTLGHPWGNAPGARISKAKFEETQKNLRLCLRIYKVLSQ
jgi:hypothetical protein